MSLDVGGKPRQWLLEKIGSTFPDDPLNAACVVELDRQREEAADAKQGLINRELKKQNFWTRVIAIAGIFISLAHLIWNMSKEIWLR